MNERTNTLLCYLQLIRVFRGVLEKSEPALLVSVFGLRAVSWYMTTKYLLDVPPSPHVFFPLWSSSRTLSNALETHERDSHRAMLPPKKIMWGGGRDCLVVKYSKVNAYAA